MIDRRHVLTGAAALAVAPALAAAAAKGSRLAFPKGFLWGASTAPHQIEGNNTASDLWFIENQQPTVFAEPSGDAANSFLLWQRDLDLARSIGLNTYRFGVEWSRIEPVKGQFSQAMLDHYKAVVDGCLARGLTPVVTYSHFTAPLWFSAMGGWTNRESTALFARFAERVTRAIGDRIHSVITLNEPNILLLLRTLLPPQVWDIQQLTNETAARRLGVPRFVCGNVAGLGDLNALQVGLLNGHRAARAAIKSVQPRLPVGVSLAMFDDQAAGPNSIRDRMRAEIYGEWLGMAKEGDFIGVQNYERAVWGSEGRLPAPADAVRNHMGSEVWAPSLAGAVRYAHAATGLPVLVSEHGVGTDDDRIRAAFIPAALRELHGAMAEGVPVLGYCHWSLIDNYEWTFGFKPKYGLASFDRQTFVRTPKPSAAVLGRIARANAVA